MKFEARMKVIQADNIWSVPQVPDKVNKRKRKRRSLICIINNYLSIQIGRFFSSAVSVSSNSRNSQWFASPNREYIISGISL
jgi:hypothetical protein